MKKLTCRDVGVECDVVFEATTDDEVMEMAAKHAAEEHNLPEIPPTLDKKCRGSIEEIKEN